MVKNLPDNAQNTGLISGSGRSPGEGNGNQLQYSCLENPMDRGACRLQYMGSQRVGHDSAAEQGHVQPIISPFLCIPFMPEQDSYQAFTSLGYVFVA